VCAVLGALMGANLRDIVRDYVDSYNDSALIDDYPEFSESIVEDLREMNGGEELNDKNLKSAVENFLKNKVQLTQEELAALKEKLKAH
jgi:hypothetical protein